MQICCVVCFWCVFFYICNEFHCNHWLNALLFSIVWCFGTVRLSWCCRDCYMCSRHCWGFYAEYFRVVDWPTLCPFLMRRYSIFFPSCCNVFSSDLLSPPLFNTNWRPCFELFYFSWDCSSKINDKYIFIHHDWRLTGQVTEQNVVVSMDKKKKYIAWHMLLILLSHLILLEDN